MMYAKLDALVKAGLVSLSVREAAEDCFFGCMERGAVVQDVANGGVLSRSYLGRKAT